MGEEAYDLEGGDGDEEMAFSDKTVRRGLFFSPQTPTMTLMTGSEGVHQEGLRHHLSPG